MKLLTISLFCLRLAFSAACLMVTLFAPGFTVERILFFDPGHFTMPGGGRHCCLQHILFSIGSRSRCDSLCAVHDRLFHYLRCFGPVSYWNVTLAVGRHSVICQPCPWDAANSRRARRARPDHHECPDGHPSCRHGVPILDGTQRGSWSFAWHGHSLLRQRFPPSPFVPVFLLRMAA